MNGSKRRGLRVVLCVLIGLGAASLVHADEELDGAALFQQRTCFTCHGKDGKTPILPMYPKIAGQNPEYSLQQMKDIKSGVRANGNSAAMRGVMHLVDEGEMKKLADYLSTLDR